MKRFNFIVAILVVIAIGFLLVMTIMGALSDEDQPLVATTPPVTTTTPTPTPTPRIDVPIPSDDPVEPILPPIIGTEFTFTAPIAREKLTLTIDTATYTHDASEYSDMFYETEDGTREVFIEILFVPGDMEEQKYGFLDGYLPDAQPPEYAPNVRVANSAVPSFAIMATGNGRNVDGWLIEAEGGFFAIVAGFKTIEQGEYIYRMLSTLVFEK